ncbi:unnamed protein product [Candidula unifasciata]|uniref:Thioredoxin domain-containing protein n=1 Tax=Candidula unifasciata TaxID=100452 RepID=A0A8S4A1X0_9EUPU|nr:unnamed protein product [Candidula unifasciata]
MDSRSNTSRQSGHFSYDGEAERSMRRDMDSSDAGSIHSYYSSSSRRSPPPIPTTPRAYPGTPHSPGGEKTPELPPRKGPPKEKPIPRARGVYNTLPVRDDATVPRVAPMGRNPRESMMADSSFLSGNVIALNEQNFEFYITPKEKAIIYFYDTSSGRNTHLQNSFSDAADLPMHPSYGFGAVNCFRDPNLCDRYQVTQTPTLRLFSNGFLVSSINRPETISTEQMQQLMKMTPVLTQPRAQIGKKLIEQSEANETKKKHFPFR